jgi:hypothetical protein
VVESVGAWDPSEPDQGGLSGKLETLDGSPPIALRCALPHFALSGSRLGTGRHAFSLAGLGYRAVSSGQLVDNRPPGFISTAAQRSDLPPIRRCNADYRGRIEGSAFLNNPLSGARLAYARLDCDQLRLEIIIDVASLSGGLAEGAYLEGSAWVVAAPRLPA